MLYIIDNGLKINLSCLVLGTIKSFMARMKTGNQLAIAGDDYALRGGKSSTVTVARNRQPKWTGNGGEDKEPVTACGGAQTSRRVSRSFNPISCVPAATC